MRGRRVGEGEDMTGEESYGKDYENRGKEELWERRDCSSGLGFSGSVVGFCSFW
jgi:hypothetical protein